MRNRTTISMIAVTAAAVGAVISLSVTQPAGQAVRPARTADGHPNLSGIWQANNEAHWDLQAHAARAGAVVQQGSYDLPYVQVPAAPSLPFGAAGGVPGSLGVVHGDGQIPYNSEAATLKQENEDNWLDRDPEIDCFLPGTPRAMYMPYPFQITQSTNKIYMNFTYSNAARTIHLDEVEPPPDYLYMGHSVGRWEGDTLVVDVTDFNDLTWFDRAGNHHSNQMTLVERYTPITPDAINYEVTIEDPATFTEPWTISMPLYRRLEPNIQLLEYRCQEFVEEHNFGHLRKEQLVKRWEGKTMIVDITRKVPDEDDLYER